MTILGLQLARPRFHLFLINFLLKNNHFGAPAGQAQIPLISYSILIKEWPFWGSTWPGPDSIDFLLISY